MSDQAVQPVRTVCHACRGTAYAHVAAEDGTMVSRPVIVPGDGEVIRTIMTLPIGETAVSEPCDLCGTTEDSGWTGGFIIPV